MSKTTAMDKSAASGEEPLTAAAVAKRVNWYTPAEALLGDPPLFIAQIMARGGAREIVWMQREFTLAQQRAAYQAAPAGLFDRRAWAYWGLMLLGAPDALPYPVRFPDAAAQLAPWPGF